MHDRVRRTDALQIQCPQCSSGPGVACIGARTNYRISCHAGRHVKAIAAGYPPLALGEKDPTMADAAPTVGVTPPGAGRRERKARRRQAFWNKLEFICHSCSRRFPPATIRIVRYDGRYWCDRCYRDAAGIPHTD